MTGLTDAMGQVLFSRLELIQLLTELSTDEEPLLDYTTFWVIQESTSADYFLNPTPQSVTFTPDDREVTYDVVIPNESTAMPYLSLQNGGYKIQPNRAVIFQDVLSTNGKISYDAQKGLVRLHCTGLYVVMWTFSVQSGLSADKSNFAIQLFGDNIVGSNTFMPAQTQGYALINATTPNQTFALVNASTRSVTLSSKVQVNATLTVMKLANLPVPRQPLSSLQLQLGTDTILVPNTFLRFDEVVVASSAPTELDYNPFTGEFHLGRGIFLIKWEFPLLATGKDDVSTLLLKSTQAIEHTWVAYATLPSLLIAGSALVVNHQPAETLHFTLPPDSGALSLSAHANVTITQIQRFGANVSCLEPCGEC